MDLNDLFGLKKDKETNEDPSNIGDKLVEKVKEMMTATPDADEAKMIQDHMNKIEADYGGVANIPADKNHTYWHLRNRLQQLQNPE